MNIYNKITNITSDYTFITFGSALIFFLTFESFIVTLGSTNMTSDYTFVTFCGTIFFFTFNSSIVTLDSTNIKCDFSFFTFDGSLIFFLHLTVPLSHWATPKSHTTVLLSHSMIHFFFFSHLMVLLSH